MKKEHHYELNLQWTGNKGSGTSGYTAYDRDFSVSIKNKKDLLCSSDTAFRGDATKHNPEDLLLGALSSCHMLWYLHLCADAGIIVIDYRDSAQGTMLEKEGGGGNFTDVLLKPVVTINNVDKVQLANELHAKASEKCFIANSVNFKVRHQPVCKVSSLIAG